MFRDLNILIFAILLLITPVMAGTTLFVPSEGSVSSTGVKDITNAPGGSLVFATDTGLSEYNGEWTITHVNRTDIGHKDVIDVPLNDYILAVEYDSRGNLWLGYTNGLQIHNSSSTITIRDQQLLKNLDVRGLQKRGDEMWVATGNAGLHCYLDGEWTWYKPFSEGAPECYQVAGMAVDYSTGALIVSSEEGGAWILAENGGYKGFVRLVEDDEFISSGMGQVRSSSFGGVFLFNTTAVVGYNNASGLYPILSVEDLNDQSAAQEGILVSRIYDIVQANDGQYVIATDGGILCWKDGQVTMHLGQWDIKNNIVHKLFIDNSGRWWFANQHYVGYYLNDYSSPVMVLEIPDSQVNNTSASDVSVVPPSTSGMPWPFEDIWNWLNSLF